MTTHTSHTSEVDLKRNPMGIYEKALPRFETWEQALESTRRCGFDFMEFSVDETEEKIARLWWSPAERRELRRAIAETGVPVRTIALSGHRRIAFASEDPATRERAWEMMSRALDLCTEFGIRVIQTPGHDVYYEASTEDTWQRWLEALARMAEMGRSASIMIAIENADKACVGSLEQARDLIVQVNSPWLQMYPDVGNTAAHGYSVPEQLQVADPYMAVVHLKDTRIGEFRRVPFGEGIVPFEEVFHTLTELRYAGPFVIEMWNEAATDPDEVIRDARDWLRARMP